jgi:hypothetical protein
LHPLQAFFKVKLTIQSADNGSDASSVAVLESLSRRDPAVLALLNRMNYGAEASAGVPRPSNRCGSPLAGQTSTACS